MHVVPALAGDNPPATGAVEAVVAGSRLPAGNDRTSTSADPTSTVPSATWNPPPERRGKLLTVLDTHEIARELTAAGIAPDHADAITRAGRRAAEHDALGLDVSTLATKADLTSLELRLVKWMIGIVFAGAGLVIAAVRFIG